MTPTDKKPFNANPSQNDIDKFAGDIFERTVTKCFFSTAISQGTAEQKRDRFKHLINGERLKFEHAIDKNTPNETLKEFTVSNRILQGIRTALEQTGGLSRGTDYQTLVSAQNKKNTMDEVIEECFEKCHVDQCRQHAAQTPNPNV